MSRTEAGPGPFPMLLRVCHREAIAMTSDYFPRWVACRSQQW
jgi:hypothetical protein